MMMRWVFLIILMLSTPALGQTLGDQFTFTGSPPVTFTGSAQWDGGTQTPPTITGITPSSGNFTAGIQNGFVANLQIALSDGSFVCNQNVALSVTGTNSGGFHTAGCPTPQLLQSSAANGTPAGTYNDFSVVATLQGGSPFSVSQDWVGVTGYACDIGPPLTTIPAPAAAAGMTHCSANFDFSTAAFADPNTNWMDVGYNDATKMWHQGSPGIPNASQDIHQTVDPVTGDTVLLINYTPADFNISVVLGIETADPNAANNGLVSFARVNFYEESTYRAGPECFNPPNGCGPGGFWNWTWAPDGEHIEWDIGELYTDQERFADGPGWQSYNSATPMPPNWTVLNYSTYAALITGDGTGNGNKLLCPYVDGMLMNDCANYGPAGASPATENVPIWLIADAESHLGPGPDGNITRYFKNIHIWTCPGDTTPVAANGACKGSSLFTGTQDGRSLQYYRAGS